MKKLLIGILTLLSFSCFADVTCLKNKKGQEVCLKYTGSQHSSNADVMYYNFVAGYKKTMARDALCYELLGVNYNSSFFERILRDVDLACVSK